MANRELQLEGRMGDWPMRRRLNSGRLILLIAIQLYVSENGTPTAHINACEAP